MAIFAFIFGIGFGVYAHSKMIEDTPKNANSAEKRFFATIREEFGKVDFNRIRSMAAQPTQEDTSQAK